MVHHPALEIRRILVTPLDEREGFVNQVVVMLVAPDEVHVERVSKCGRFRVASLPRFLFAAATKRSLLGDPQPTRLIQDLNMYSLEFINESGHM